MPTGRKPGDYPESTSAPTALVQELARALGISAAKARAAIVAAHKGGLTWAQATAAAYASLSGGPEGHPEGDGSSGSGGGLSSGGSSGPSWGTGEFGSQNREQAMANAVNTFRNMVTAWGIEVDNSLMKFIQNAVANNMNSAAFISALRKTKAYAKAFPGIMRNDGTMRMTEAQYMAGYQSAKDYAHSVGRNISLQQYGLAIKNGNSPTEIRQKVEALDILKSNRVVFKQFSDYLEQTGQVKGQLTRQELLKFIMKQGPKEWEDAWTVANEAAILSKFNFDVGPGGDIGWKGLKKLEAQLLPGEKADYTALAQAAETLGASRLYSGGITKRDLLKLTYNAKGADKIAARVKLMLGTWQATASEQRANPDLTRQGQYQGTPQVQATE